MWQPAYLVSGALVGIVIGLTGIGGGSLMTPLLILVFRQSPVVAVGTDLVFAAATKLVATATSGLQRRVDWPVVANMAAGSLPAAVATLYWLKGTHDPGPVVASIVIRALAVMLLLTSVSLVLQPRLQGLIREQALRPRRWPWLQPLATVLAGAAVGCAVTLTSVGAGALGTVALLFVYPLRLTPARLVATDLAHALPLALVAGAGHAVLGHVDYDLLLNLLAGSIPGVLVGTFCAPRAPAWLLRGLISVMLAATGGRLLWA
jgi:uncharacterized protein